MTKDSIQLNLSGDVARPYYDPEYHTDDFDLTYLSFGAGIQSTALLICSALGWHNVPKVDVAIFADTEGEIEDTYEHLAFMTEWAAGHGIEVAQVSQGNLQLDILEGGVRGPKTRESFPAFVKRDDGSRGILHRRCTRDYKITMIQKEVRKRLGLKPGQVAKGKYFVRCMLGISLDEIIRMKPAVLPWVLNHYPLIDAGLTREDCKEIITKAGIPLPPKSACWYCPYHRDSYWSYLKHSQPEYWKKAVEFDAQIRHGMEGVQYPAYLHDSLKPLPEVDLDPNKQSIFGDECEGVCGV